MTYHEILDNKSIAVSTSDSPDMAGLGLHKEHLRDAMTELARHLLALGAKLVYGGDLRSEGFSKLLFELSARYRRDSSEANKLGVTNYLAWPVHILKETDQLDQEFAELEGTAELRLLDIDGNEVDRGTRQRMAAHQPTEPEWAQGLSAMRHTMLANSNARIILGGRVDKFKGEMPGIAEEALFSLQGRQPLYVMGGFGGCARDVAEELGVIKASARRSWPGRDRIAAFKNSDLANGLSDQENLVLAKTPHIDQAIVLILRGLSNIFRDEANARR